MKQGCTVPLLFTLISERSIEKELDSCKDGAPDSCVGKAVSDSCGGKGIDSGAGKVSDSGRGGASDSCAGKAAGWFAVGGTFESGNSHVDSAWKIKIKLNNLHTDVTISVS